MRKTLLLAAFLFSCLQGQAGLSAYFSYGLFNQPEKGPYLETYLTVTGPSAQVGKTEGNKFQSKVEVQWVIRRNDSIITFDKYNLLGPLLDSITGFAPDFTDLHRFQIAPGKYTLELKISDKVANGQAFTATQDVEVDFPSDATSISSVEFAESAHKATSTTVYTKSGIDLVPYVFDFFPPEVNRLRFYAEIYHSDLLKSEFLVRYSISNSNNKQVINDLAGIRKLQPSAVNVVMGELPIDNLMSGNYNLTIEVRDRDNKLIAFRQRFFQRFNRMEKPVLAEDVNLVDVTNTFAVRVDQIDSLKDEVLSIYPIASLTENMIAEHRVQANDIRSMQQFLYYFWSKRDPKDPEAAWAAYRMEVTKVNNSFGTRNHKGYETDRGRVYLQYGPPNTITKDDQDPDSYPYEIWQYYTLGEQHNRKFVFYATDRSDNNYRLLHSDARGELQDPGWELRLHSRTQQFGNDLDVEQSIEMYGSRTKENFSNPK